MTQNQSTVGSVSVKRRSGWPRYSLRALLAVLTVVSVCLAFYAIYASRAHRQQVAVEKVLTLGGTVYYEHQRSRTKSGILVIDPKAQIQKPAWPRMICGDDFFQRAIAVKLRGTNAKDADLELLEGLPYLESLDVSYTQVGDRGLERVGRLSELRSLTLIDTEVTDRGVAHLKDLERLEQLSLWNTNVTDKAMPVIGQFTNLRSLVLDGTEITDDGLVHLRGLTNLEDWLGLCHTKITDDGLIHLASLRKLKHVNLIGAKVSDEGLRELRRSLPQASISPM